jgi:hypothetical protein
LDDLRFRRVPWQDLVVSRKYKGDLGTPDGYKSENNNVYQMCTQITLQTEHRFFPGERIKFLVRKGPEPFYLRSVCINYILDPSTVQVDLLYYLKKQFYKNMVHLCLYHQQYVNVDAMYKTSLQNIRHDEAREHKLWKKE